MQQGGGAILAVVMLLVTAMMMFIAQHRQLDSTWQLALGEQHYLQAYNQAASALNWGLAQNWPKAKLSAARWYCQHMQQNKLSVCARFSSRSGIILLRAAGNMRANEPLWLYQLARLTVTGKLVAEKHSRLDFCPDRQEIYCMG